MKTLVLAAALLLLPFYAFSQLPTWWTVNGNNASNGDFIGTLNNEPLIFKVNNQEAMRLKPNGELRLNSLAGYGNGIMTVNNNGNVGMTAFPGDTDKVLTGTGQFRNIYAISGWKRVGNNVVNNNGAFIGIGTNNPQYILDVDGTVRFNGIVNATGINIVNKLQADTIKGVSMIDVNGTLGLTGGLTSEMFANTGDLKLQSRSGYNGNLLLGVGTTSNIGVGIFSPQYKLDVYGDVRLNGRTHVFRLVPLPGDSTIFFGDSTIIMIPSLNNIQGSVSSNVKGLGLGSVAFGFGYHSTAIGTAVRVAQGAQNSITIGSGVSSGQYLQNSIPNSLIIGFNSTVPTFFVGSSNGAGTTGKVGIGTTSPQSEFQVGESVTKVTVGPAFAVGNTFSTAYVGFNVARAGGGWITDASGSNGGVVLLSEIGGGFRIIGVPSTGGTSQVLTDQQVIDNTRFQIQPSGRVLIGPGGILPGSPYNDNQTMLTVNGRIMCKDAIVSLVDWPDYVFDSSYVLMPMDSLSGYINANKHLPGIPAAAEQEQNGVSLAETCKQQQEQIESLTLYILQLNERLKALEAEKIKKEGGN